MASSSVVPSSTSELPTSTLIISTPIDTRTWPSTLIGPLTTTFTPPSSCVSHVYLPTSTNAEGAWMWLNLGPTDPENCLPPGWGPSAYYSPAQCPLGYSTNGVQPVGSETQAICCPSNAKGTYTLRPGTSPTPSWYPTELCQTQPYDGTTGFLVTTYLEGGSTSIIGTSVDPNQLINAYGISIRWKEGDFRASASATPTATQSMPNAAASDGLSTGAKAGVGVGVTLAVLLVIGLLLAFFFRRKKQQGVRVSSQDQPYTGDAIYAPSDGQNPYGKNFYGLSEYQQGPHELPCGQSDAGLSNDSRLGSAKFKSKLVELDAQ